VAAIARQPDRLPSSDVSEPGRSLRILVTGAASGIGAATVRRLRADGARVAGIDRNQVALAAVELDARATADVALSADLTRAVDLCCDALGGLDGAVACAGVAGRGTAADTEEDEWDRIFAVNVRGVYLTARAVIPHLRRAGGGAIVNVASQLGLVAAANAAAYCASKGAVVQLTRAMAVDHGPEGICVNCVCPGPTDTPLLEPYFGAAADPAAEREVYERAQLHGRLVTADEIADAIAYLLSPAARSTMGAALVVDGGYTIR
jgi:NAD(P)-dependent dehydrogenase (short-subunit alcohol dehydrogenase family)